MLTLRWLSTKLRATSNRALLAEFDSPWNYDGPIPSWILAHDNKRDFHVHIHARAWLSRYTTHFEDSGKSSPKVYIHLYINRGWVFNCLLRYGALNYACCASWECTTLRKDVRDRLYLSYLWKEVLVKALFKCSVITTVGLLDNIVARGRVHWPPSKALWAGSKSGEPELHNWILQRRDANLYKIEII